MTPERAEGIERAVEEAVERWQASGPPDAAVEVPTETPAVADIVRPMPRRQLVHTFDAAAATLPMARRPTYRAGVLYPLLRLLVWMRVFVYFVCGCSRRRAAALASSLSSSRREPIFYRTLIAQN
jgi:hypothetical protein